MKLLAAAAIPLLPLMLGACSAAVPAAVVIGGVALAGETVACAAQTIANDEAQSPQPAWTQVALDLANICGMDVGDIAALFGEAHPVTQAARANAPAVHAAALTKRAADGGAPAPAPGAGSAGPPAASSK